MELRRFSFSRLFAKMEKINKLQTGYLDKSDEIAALKERRRALKERLRQVRAEVEAMKEATNVEEWDRKLMKADKRTAIEGMERVLERTKGDIARLQRSNDRTFEKRERLKARALKGLEFGVGGGAPVVVMNRVDDVAAVAKLMELTRVSPMCKIGESVAVGSSDAIREAASKLKVEIEREDGCPASVGEGREVAKEGTPAGVKEPKLKQVAPVSPFDFRTTSEPTKPVATTHKKKAAR